MKGVPTGDLSLDTREELCRLNLLKDEGPSLPAIVLGLAIKYPYGDCKEGKVVHAYRWLPDHLKRFLKDGDDNA